MGPSERHAVLEQMHADGKKLTVDTYSAAVGGGDRTRLTRELRTFRDEIAARGDRLELPQPFVHALDVMRHLLAAGTTELISGADARARIVEDSLRSRAREDLEAATGRLAELQDTHEETAAQLADTQRLADERGCQIATLEQRLRDLTHQLDRPRDATDTERSRLTAPSSSAIATSSSCVPTSSSSALHVRHSRAACTICVWRPAEIRWRGHDARDASPAHRAQQPDY